MNKVLKIETSFTDEYVYDIENPDGTFVCGTNQIVVQQSDSQYNKFAAKSDVKYGDSVVPETPIMTINDAGQVKFINIKNLGDGFWKSYDNFKPGEPERTDKQQCNCFFRVWDGIKWTAVKRVIRHRVNKKLYKVLTNSGFVICTEDHSLISAGFKYVKPTSLSIGDELFCGYPDNLTVNCDKTNFPLKTNLEKIGYFYGIFFGINEKTDTNVFNMVSCKRELLSECVEILTVIHPTIDFSISMGADLRWVLRPVKKGDSVLLSKKYNNICYCRNKKFKIVPKFVLKYKQIYTNFICGILKSKGELSCIGQIGASGLYYLLRNLGMFYTIHESAGNFSLRKGKNVNQGTIVKIECVNYKVDYVYDIETEAGKFQAGVGTMIVKNTDSIYTQFIFPDDKALSKEEKLSRTWELASECADRISFTFKKPIELEMEKIMWPLYLYGKKRYACKVYEKQKNGSFSSKRDLKGIQAVRRDNCKLVKTIATPVFNQLLDRNDTQGAVDVVHKYVKLLFENKLDIEEFMVTKSINSTYKALTDVRKFLDGSINIKEDFVKINGRKMSIPGHVILAKKMRQRKVMDPPQIGDRIPFVYVEVSDKKAKGGERMEDPNYVIENPTKCKIDPMFYMEKQIASPLYTVFEVLVTDEEGNVYPRKIKVDKLGKETSEISKECKEAINKLLWNELIKGYRPNENNHFIKKPKPKPQVKITDLFQRT